MRVLVACEVSGVVRDAFIEKGHDAWSCDLFEVNDFPEGLFPNSPNHDKHLKCDVRTILREGWDLMIGHPPCTYLSSSGLFRNKNNPERQKKTEEAIEFFLELYSCGIPKIALENPIGCLSTRVRKPDQIIQPWWFGEDASKATCLWLKNLPKLEKTNPLIKKRYANQTPSGQNKLGPSKYRSVLRSITYKKVAEAMANQWT